MRSTTILICFLCTFRAAIGQQILELNKEYNNIELKKTDVLHYTFDLTKGGIYQFSILQQGIAVHYLLIGPDDKELYESNYPDDFVGYEKFEYTANNFGKFNLQIKRFDDPENPDSGLISIFIKSLSKAEI